MTFKNEALGHYSAGKLLRPEEILAELLAEY